MATGTARDYELHELGFISELNDNDLLLIENVSTPLPLKKIRLCSLRSSFIGGWPSLDDTPERVLTPPGWNLKGVDGGWRIRIETNVIADTDWYFIYKLNHASGEYVVVHAIAESRDPGERGPLEYIHLAEETDPPNRYYGTFKIQSVSHEYQGPLSDADSAWTLYDLPSDWFPDAPTLLTAGSYPLISYSLLPDGGLGYTISLKIQAPADQKNLVREYVIDRICDEGTGSFTGKPIKTNNLTIKASPRPKIVLWHDTDRSFVPTYKYRYNVYAKALNDNIGAVSNTQDVTLTDDTTAPDDPTFTVETSAGGIEVTFDPIEVGGNPDVGWSHILLQYRIDDGAWTEIRLDKTLFYAFPVTAANYEDAYDFRAKVVDYAGNENEGGWQLDDGGYTAGLVTELMFGVDLYNKIQKIEVNEGNISTHETEITQNASDIVLRALQTSLDTTNGNVITNESAITVNATAIALRATTAALNTVDGKVDTNTGEITVNATAIALRATTAALNTVDGKVDTNTGEITVNADNILLRVSKNDVINQINISTEGIQIDADNIKISGSTTFSAGYNPTSKLNHTAGSYQSAAAAARILIFPDANTGIQVIDDAAADVFKVMVGGADVGDVIIGASAGQHVKWDKSASKLEIEAILSADGIKTGSGSNKIEIGTFGGKEMMRLGGGTGRFVVDTTPLGATSALLDMTYTFEPYQSVVTFQPDGFVYSVQEPPTVLDEVAILETFIGGTNAFARLILKYGAKGSAAACFTADNNVNTTGVYKIAGTTVLSGQMTIQTDIAGVIAQLKAVGLMAAA